MARFSRAPPEDGEERRGEGRREEKGRETERSGEKRRERARKIGEERALVGILRDYSTGDTSRVIVSPVNQLPAATHRLH